MFIQRGTIALDVRSERNSQDLDRCGAVDAAYRDRVHRHAFSRAHEQAFVSFTPLFDGDGSGPLRGGASLHQESRAFCGLLHFELFSVSRLACHAAFAVGSAMGVALGGNRFHHVRHGGEPGRMASDFHSVANRRIQRCRPGQLCGVDRANSNISFSELETTENDRCRGLRTHASDWLRNSLSSTLRTPWLAPYIEQNEYFLPYLSLSLLADLIRRFFALRRFFANQDGAQVDY